MAAPLDVTEALDKASQGGKLSKAELEAVAKASAALRQDFLQDAFRAIGNLTPHTTDFIGFKNCLKSMTDFLMARGFVTIGEIQALWMTIEESER